ncbi:hypothetical protein [Cyanobium sp. Morenito 9A2]|uniref:hypothetical protein n=1 Tax=Cyanobium sp. Morenito 9A2 TaxID=2823718 RepID=UPI0020CC2664|nr:hypothetical protein [Cyanobium sp. Morenito 9A2]MCP9848597.1 hypothetical protein [Cyanobium sp. Morenito 9A2]
MARMILVLKTPEPVQTRDLIPQLLPVLEGLEASIDQQAPAHLSALFRSPPEGLALQLFADVQPQAGGPELDVVVMSREPMGKGAPVTQRAFERLIALVNERAPGLQICFRSDRDGPLPRQQSVA